MTRSINSEQLTCGFRDFNYLFSTWYRASLRATWLLVSDEVSLPVTNQSWHGAKENLIEALEQQLYG